MFWVWIVVAMLVIVGLSVWVGKVLSKPKAGDPNLSRHAQVTALKASGALKHRKSNRN
jgi:hypothetical protein